MNKLIRDIMSQLFDFGEKTIRHTWLSNHLYNIAIYWIDSDDLKFRVGTDTCTFNYFIESLEGELGNENKRD